MKTLLCVCAALAMTLGTTAVRAADVSDNSGGVGKKMPVVVNESAATAHKDWWDKSYVISNGLLVIIGAFGVIAALKTLNAITKQIEIQQESLRPRLTIGFNKGPYPEMILGKRVVLDTEIINTGGIPAYEVIAETWIEWLDRPFEFTSAALYHKGDPLTVHPREPSHYRVPFNRGLTEAEILAFRSAKATVCLRIKLTYTAFGRGAHTQEAVAVEPGSMGIIAKYSEAN